MHNSHVVGGLVKIWQQMMRSYEYSLVKKMFDGIKKLVGFITKDSKVIGFFTRSRPTLGNSFVYRGYSWLIERLNQFMDKINSRLSQIQDKSLVDTTINSLVASYNSLIRSTLVFTIFFSLGILGQSLIYSKMGFKLNLFLGLVMVISFIMLRAGENIVAILKNSYFINMFLNLISLEEEGSDQWW